MPRNIDEQLHLSAKYLRKREGTGYQNTTVDTAAWAAMLEEAEARIIDLEAHLERLVA